MAAALLGAPNSTTNEVQTNKVQSPVKNPVSGSQPEFHKSKDLTRQTFSLAAPTNLTAPVLNVAQPLPPVTAEAEENNVSIGQPIDVRPDSSESTTGGAAIYADEVRAKLTGNVGPSLGLTQLPPAPNEAPDVDTPAAGFHDARKTPLSADDVQSTSIPLAATGWASDKSGSQETASVLPAASAIAASQLSKAPVDSSQATGVEEPVKPVASLATGGKKPNMPADAGAAAGAKAVPADTLPLTAALDQTSNPPVKEMLASSISQKAAAQSSSVGADLKDGARDAKTAASRSAVTRLSRSKDRDDKDLRGGTSQSAKPDSQLGAKIVQASASLTAEGDKETGSIALPIHATTHGKPAIQIHGAAATTSATSSAETDGPDEALPGAASSPVTAKFVQGMSQSEFRVGMQSQEFGNIDIRTSVNRHMFSAQISAEHSDMARSLATELPTLYSKLADQHVPVANIVIHGQSLATSSGLAQDTQQRPTWRSSPQSQGNTSSNAETVPAPIAESLAAVGRLDIRI